MNPESRQTIHMGINFVFAPPPAMDKQSHLRFQQALVGAGIEYTGVRLPENQIEVQCGTANPLVIKVIGSDPRIGQLLILAPQAAGSLGLDMFIKDSEAVVKAFEETRGGQRQILASDVTLRDLFDTTHEHAFQELWEHRLGQPEEALKVLGRGIQGGGLRLVIPPLAGDTEPVQIELKIESYLRDSQRLWVETIFKWPQPRAVQERMDPGAQLRQADRYVEECVVKFMMGG